MNLQEQAKASFKNYDIRGLTGTQLTEELAYAIGNAFVTQEKLTNCLVGRDPRQGALELHNALITGMRDAGCSVTDLGVASTSQLKWAVVELELEGLAITTASHNPPEYCGFKLYSPQNIAMFEGRGLHELKEKLANPTKAAEQGALVTADMREDYINFLLRISHPMSGHVFIDPSGGSGCPETHTFAEKVGFEVTLFNAESDPLFSVHPADPTKDEALEAAKDFCGINGCIGAVFDGDCDRVALIDEKGNAISSDVWGAWYVDQVAKQEDLIVGAVGTTEALRAAIHHKKATFKLSKVGHPHVQTQVRENKALIGVERSGHLYFPEVHDGESPLLVILKTLELLQGTTLHDAIQKHKEGLITSPNMNARVDDPQAVVDQATRELAELGTFSDLDGAYVYGEGWWINIRKSNTEPIVRIKYQSRDKEQYDKLTTIVNEILSYHDAHFEEGA